MDQLYSDGRVLVVGGVVIQYIATRLSVGVLGRQDGSAPGRQALGQWLPIFATALAAVVMRKPAIAVALVFGSSVAILSLILGMTTYVAPLGQLPPERRVWPLVLPAALLVLLAGFHGIFTWYHAVMLLVMGAAFLGVWVEQASLAPAARAADPPGQTALPWAFIILALILAGAGAWATARGTVLASELSRRLPVGLLAATIISPLLLLPALGVGTTLAQRGHTPHVITSLCGTVLLNLCVLLPIIILVNYLLGGLAGHTGPTPFPLITWRVDAVVLLILGFALVPIAAGRWVPERFESMLLIVIYAAYLIAQMWLSVRFVG